MMRATPLPHVKPQKSASPTIMSLTAACAVKPASNDALDHHIGINMW